VNRVREPHLFHYKSEHLNRLLALLDISVSALVYLVVLKIYMLFRPLDADGYLGHLGLLVLITLAIAICRRLLSPGYQLHGGGLWRQAGEITMTMVATFVVIVVALFLFDVEFVSRLLFVGFFIANTLVLIGIRAFLTWWYFSSHKEKRENYLRVLIIGSGQRAHLLARRLKGASEWGLQVVGFLDPSDPDKYNHRENDNVLGHVSQISEVLRSNIVDEIIIAVPRRMLDDIQAIIDACQEEGVKLRYMADLYDFEAARVKLTMVGNIPLLSFEPVAQNETMLIVKRFVDLVMTIFAFPFLVPIFVLVSVAIRMDSPGPAIFTQERMGLHKRRFRLFKFRTMVVDAEVRMAEVEHLNEAEGPNFKIANDPRMTRLGAFLRKTSIDELPQLLNVLLGDMSLVGPRPMSLRDVNLFDKGIQRKRFSVRPGLTCLWQVSGRSNLSFDDWLRLDLKYIDNWSLGLDFKILFRTVPAVLKGSGAA